jgi:bacterial/archaeal transporter family-2 protein
MGLSLPLGMAFLAGAALSMQAFLNGRLGVTIGSAEFAALVNNLVGLAALLVVAGASGSLARAAGRLRNADRGRPWHYATSGIGAIFVIVAAIAAPKVGIALLTVAVVCGQTLGSVAADALGLSPAGRRGPTPARLLGVTLALVAVGTAALGSEGGLHLGLLALAMGSGVGLAVGQAGLGQLTQRTGEPLAAATIGFAIGAVLTAGVVAAVGWGSPPNGWSAPIGQWAGGLFGATVVVGLGRLVIALGVLRLTLALVAGQSLGALALDLAAPTAGREVTLRTVGGVLLTFAAVAVSGMTLRRKRQEPLLP